MGSEPDNGVLAPTLAPKLASSAERAPRVYYIEDRSYTHNWIAEGTDGNLYLVPAEAGGWLRRSEYRGLSDQLEPVAFSTATTVAWYVYGDIGSVTIEGTT
jgi:hypothetical protein